MPISKKRKGAKKYRPARTELSPSAENEGSYHPPALSGAAVQVRRVLTFFPFVAGAWITGGLVLPNTAMFLAFFAGAVGAHYYGVEKLRRVLGVKTVRRILLGELTGLVEAMVFAIAGGFSQYFVFDFRLALFGFVPGCFLVAAAVAENAEIFEREGWLRSREVTKKNGEKTLRPGSLTQLFTFAFILGPLVPIALAPLGLLPVTLLLPVVPLYFMPMIANGFFERLQSNAVTADRCVRASGLAAVLTLAGGLLAVY